jgi:hypothetical protein
VEADAVAQRLQALGVAPAFTDASELKYRLARSAQFKFRVRGLTDTHKRGRADLEWAAWLATRVEVLVAASCGGRLQVLKRCLAENDPFYWASPVRHDNRLSWRSTARQRRILFCQSQYIDGRRNGFSAALAVARRHFMHCEGDMEKLSKTSPKSATTLTTKCGVTRDWGLRFRTVFAGLAAALPDPTPLLAAAAAPPSARRRLLRPRHVFGEEITAGASARAESKASHHLWREQASRAWGLFWTPPSTFPPRHVHIVADMNRANAAYERCRHSARGVLEKKKREILFVKACRLSGVETWYAWLTRPGGQ